ncbi:MAG: hypothetical protein J0M02_04990 [Planctomycetes bacterium]|nr:hypothetical protein [Planctomycetota bacterium]
MSKALLMLTACLRPALIAVAVLAVLAMGLRMHLHAPHVDGHGHQHQAEVDLGAIHLDQGCDGDEGPANPDDATDCGQCHCPPATIAVPEVLRIPYADRCICVKPPGYAAAVPDGLNYPPDLPPERLV